MRESLVNPVQTPRGRRLAALAPVAATLGGASLIAFAPILVRVSEVGPQASAFWRLALGALTLWAAAAWLRPAPPDRQARPGLLAAGAFFAGDLACWHAAIVLTTVANATLLANLTPIVAGLAAWGILRERLSWGWALGAGLGVSGAALLGLSRQGLGQGQALGDVLALVTTLWYAAYLLAIRNARKRTGALQAMLWSSAAGAVICLVIALAAGERLFPETLSGWAGLAALGVIVHACGQGGIAFGLGRLPVAVTSVLILIQPVLAAGLGWRLFGEAIAPLGVLGAALVLAGAWAAQRAKG